MSPALSDTPSLLFLILSFSMKFSIEKIKVKKNEFEIWEKSIVKFD